MYSATLFVKSEMYDSVGDLNNISKVCAKLGVYDGTYSGMLILVITRLYDQMLF